METKTKHAEPGAEGASPSPGGAPKPELPLGEPSFLAGAFSVYADLRDKGPVVRVSIPETKGEEGKPRRSGLGNFFGHDVYFVGQHAEVAEVLRDERFGCNPLSLMSEEQRAKMPPVAEELRPFMFSLANTDPPDHTRLRRLIQPSFNVPAMEALRPRIQRIAEDLLSAAEREAEARGERAPDRRMDLAAAFAYPLPIIVIGELVGIPHADQDQVRRWTESLSANRGSRGLDGGTRENMRLLIAYLRDLFEEKRRRPTDDLTSRLVHAQEDGDKLSEDELLSIIILVYMAGHVTTVNLLGNGAYALLAHPEQLAKLRQNPALARGAVEETLRYWGPVDYLVNRIATTDVEIGGASIKRGERLVVGLASAGRDTQRFEDPDVFDITRADATRHLGFGRGIHQCLGAPLARIEGEVAFTTLFQRYPDLRLAAPPAEIPWGTTVLRGIDPIHVLF